MEGANTGFQVGRRMPRRLNVGLERPLATCVAPGSAEPKGELPGLRLASPRTEAPPPRSRSKHPRTPPPPPRHPAAAARPRPEPARGTACVSLPPHPAPPRRPPPRPWRPPTPSPMPPTAASSARAPDSRPEGLLRRWLAARPSLRAHRPAAPGTASYAPDVRHAPPTGLPGTRSPRPLQASRRSSRGGAGPRSDVRSGVRPRPPAEGAPAAQDVAMPVWRAGSLGFFLSPS